MFPNMGSTNSSDDLKNVDNTNGFQENAVNTTSSSTTTDGDNKTQVTDTITRDNANGKTREIAMSTATFQNNNDRYDMVINILTTRAKDSTSYGYMYCSEESSNDTVLHTGNIECAMLKNLDVIGPRIQDLLYNSHSDEQITEDFVDAMIEEDFMNVTATTANTARTGFLFASIDPLLVAQFNHYKNFYNRFADTNNMTKLPVLE
jgi:hypothetical protein